MKVALDPLSGTAGPLLPVKAKFWKISNQWEANLFSFLSWFVLADGTESFHNELLPGDLNLWT